MTYKDLISKYSHLLEESNLNPQDAINLMLELTQKESYDLYLNYNEAVVENIEKEYVTKAERLLKHEPLAHILGYEYFYGYKFIVNQDVLIPRDETQELVSNVLADIDAFFKNPTVIDVGCGSGAIGIALKKEETSINIYASDISEAALLVAKHNAINNEAEISFLQGDMLQPFIDMNLKVDVLVSNPPYIKADENLESSVKDFEPHLALFGGNDGLYFYRKIFEKAHLILNEKSMMAFEMGYDQKESLTKLAQSYYPNSRIEVLQDINGKDRMLFVYNNLNEQH